jgi:type I restriction enzyme S subunit
MKAMGWEQKPLGRCAKFLSGGTPSKSRSEFWEGEIPWVSSGEMTEARIYDTQLHITEEAAAHGSRIVPANTVLAVVRGMSLAKEFRVSITKREMAFNQDLKAFACESDIEPEFLFYALLARREHIRELATEASHGTKKLETEVLANFPVLVPRPDVQRRVVEVISTYDDLIANNQRRIALLEEAARQLYQEWFVRLRFPGNEHTIITDGVPEGWERKALGDICTDVRETVLPEELESDIPYIGLEHMPRRSITLSEWGRAEDVTSTKHRFRTGEILFGKIRPYFHKVGIAFVDGVASSDAIVIRPVSQEFRGLVLLTVSSDPFVAQASQTMREGSKMPRTDWKLMKQYAVAVPPSGLLSSFNGIVESVIEQLKTLTFQTQKLRAARDLLLPRLMSGEIAV